MRKFEIISQKEIDKNKDLKIENIVLPKRQTSKSAGYDFYLPYDIFLNTGEMKVVATGIKASLEDDEVLEIYIRSSMAIKRGLFLTNQVGIIDADYYNNPDNEGHIMIAIRNMSNTEVTLNKGERIAQGVFKKYLVTDDDNSTNTRLGGIGSTK